MTTVVASTAIHCPSCGRHLTEAEEMHQARLRCKSCGMYLIVNLRNGYLAVTASRIIEALTDGAH